MNCKTDAPMLIVFGQSNAHGHGTHLKPENEIHVPLKNVYGLARKENQAYGLAHIIWSGYTSFGMNLGETQDHTVCLATEFARMWQDAVNGGEPLPDLYVIQISIGSQGVDADDREDSSGKQDLNMWWPERPRVLHPGRLGTANISLYPLAIEILRLVVKSIREMGKNPIVLGLHWNQWETEAHYGRRAVQNAPQNYKRIWKGFAQALGMEYPLYLYRPRADVYNDPESCKMLTQFFESCAANSNLVTVLDAAESGFWHDEGLDHGVFLQDGVHYRPELHRYFAQQQWQAVKKLC